VSGKTPGRSLSSRARISGLAALACALGAFSLPNGAQAASCAAAGNETSLLTKPQEARALLCVINKTRARYDRKPVRTNVILNVAALAHSAKMLATGCFLHQCKGEPDLGERLEKAGFPGCNCHWKAAENIAYGEEENSAPRAVVRAWMNSPPHRAALLTRRFRMVGIGILPGMPKAPLNLDSATFTIELGWAGKPV
jgi:uncharacterized protein YkwD